jgi:L-fucose isomerase-like protein
MTNPQRERTVTSASTPAAPLGVLLIGRKRPGFDQQWNEIIRGRALGALTALGFESVGAESPVVDDETIGRALDRMHQRGCRALVVLQPSLGAGQLAMTVMQRWPAPVVLWATPERPEGEKVSSCSLVAQHLWSATMRQANHPFEIVYGDPDDASVRRSLAHAIALSQTVVSLRQSKVGLIGSHAPGYISMQVDPFAMSRQLGLQLHDLSLPQFIDRVRGVDEAEVRKDVDHARSLNLPMRNVTVDDLATQSRYYLALRELIAEEQLDALAVQEWPELPNVLGQWPYLAMSRLVDEGHAVSMEGDADAAVAMLAGRHLGAGHAFVTDWLEHDEETIHFWHPGTAPLGMLESPSLGQHFNIERPMVVDGSLRVDQPVTIMRIWRRDDRYVATAFEGKSIPLRRKLTGNQCLVRIDGGGVGRWFDTLCHEGMPHHPILFYGDHRETFRRFARLLNIDWIEKE